MCRRGRGTHARDPSSDPRGWRQAQRLPDRVDRVDDPVRVVGEPGEQPSACRDGHLDAGSQQGRQLWQARLLPRCGQSSFQVTARGALRATRAAPPPRRPAGGDDGPRASIHSGPIGDRIALVDVATGEPPLSWSERRVGATAPSRRTARRAVRSCSAGRVHSRAKVVRRHLHLRGGRGANTCAPSANHPGCRTGRPATHVAREVEPSRVGEYSRARAGVVATHGPYRLSAITPVRGAARTAPSRPPADSALFMCMT